MSRAFARDSRETGCAGPLLERVVSSRPPEPEDTASGLSRRPACGFGTAETCAARSFGPRFGPASIAALPNNPTAAPAA